MAFERIEMATYARREHYERYLAMNLTYSATVQIDVTDLRLRAKRQGIRTYPAQIWMLTSAANRVPEFRMERDDDGNLGVWDILHPTYTVLDDSTQSFSCLWTPYDGKFARFYAHCLSDIERYTDGSFEPQSDTPANVLNISSIPWLEFTAFNLNMPSDYLLPILTIGRYHERDGRTFMPLAIQVHHAVCDGLHLGRYVEQVRTLSDTAADWLAID